MEDGHGTPTKIFGDPQKKCKHCHKTYIDRSIIDWPTATWLQKFSFYFANGRFYICLMVYLIFSAIVANNYPGLDGGLTYLVCIPVFLIGFTLCVVYVQIRVILYYGESISPIKHGKINAKEIEKIPKIVLEKYFMYSIEFICTFASWVEKYSSKRYSLLRYLDALDSCIAQKSKESGLLICYKIYENKMRFGIEHISHMFNQLEAVLISNNEEDKKRKQQFVINGLQGFISSEILSGATYK